MDKIALSRLQTQKEKLKNTINRIYGASNSGTSKHGSHKETEL
jgi:hypothetical protein